MRTDRGVESISEGPGLEDAANLGQERLQVGFLLRQQAPNMGARRRPGTSKADDVLDLRQRQPQPAALLDEIEHAENLIVIDAIARSGAPRRWQDAACLIELQRLAAHAAPFHDLTDSRANA